MNFKESVTMVLILSSIQVFASYSSDHHKNHDEWLDKLNCIATANGHSSSETAFKIEKDMEQFEALLYLASTKGSGNSGDKDYQGCEAETIQSLESVLTELELTQEFQTLSNEIHTLYPDVNIIKVAEETVVCYTDKRLESLVGPGIGYSQTRSLVWKPRLKGEKDRILYNKKPEFKNDLQKRDILWQFTKELLHTSTLGNDYYLRDGILQRIVSSLRLHIDHKELTKEELKSNTDRLYFPSNNSTR